MPERCCSKPARAGNGLSAAAEFLLENDTARAAALLNRLRAAGDTKLAGRAGAMLKYLEPVEPAAKSGVMSGAMKDSATEDAGPVEPPPLGPLLPAVDRTSLEVLARALPKLRPDAEPAALLTSFSAEPSTSETPAVMPALAEPTVTFENTWRDVQAAANFRKALAPSLFWL